MFWLGSVLGLVIGAIIGAVLYKQFRSDAVRINQLESQLQKARHDHEAYQHQVHAHFHTTADLVHRMTDSYRDVYKHLAEGAQSLCPDTIADELSLSWENRSLLDQENQQTQKDSPADSNDAEPSQAAAPRDYAEKTDPNRGMLSEDYGLTKVSPVEQRAPQEDADSSLPKDADGPYSQLDAETVSPEATPAARILPEDEPADENNDNRQDQDQPLNASLGDEPREEPFISSETRETTDTSDTSDTSDTRDTRDTRDNDDNEQKHPDADIAASGENELADESVSTYTPSSEDSDTARRSS